jgi:glycosyltransferase involved in cell wall biosynthesis
MRNTSWFILGIGSALIWGHTASFAQDAPRPPVQVVIGPNGIKVIDPKTGKEVPSVVTRIPDAPPRIQIEIALDKKQKTSGVFEIEFDLQLDQAHKELLRAIQVQQAKGSPKVDKIEIKQLEFKIVPGPDGKPQIVTLQLVKPAPPMSMDKKIDLLLKQMDELRRDVDGIKKKLDGKGPPERFEMRFQLAPPPPPPGSDKKLDKEARDRLNELLKKLEGEAKKEAGKGPAKKQPANRDAEIERRLERILQEAEELRREIRDLKTPPKK